MTQNIFPPAEEYGSIPTRWDDDTQYDWGSSIKIFLAEDDDDLRTTLAESLRLEGYQVCEARNGEALGDILASDWRFLRHDDSTMIVCDVCMPGRSGVELLQQLRLTGWRTPVLLMTAYGSRDLNDEATQLGVSMVLNKPFSEAVFLQAVRLLSTPSSIS